MDTKVSLVILASLAALSGAAHAGDFGIDNTQLLIQPTHPSTVVTLHNNLDEPTRCQVTVVVWDQDENGQIKLSPTQDLVFFPELFTLKPKSDQPIRVGYEGKFAEKELTYRILIEELPPFEKTAPQAAMITRLRLSLPIFVQPIKVAASLRLKEINETADRLTFRIANEGSAHAKITQIKAEALDEHGSILFAKPLQAWYVLAGGVRDYALDIEPKAAGLVRAVRVEGEDDSGSFESTLAINGVLDQGHP